MIRKQFVPAVLLGALSASLLTGCIYSHRAAMGAASDPVVVVTESPPSPRTEVMTPSPGDRYEWIAGHWVREGDRWVWVPGKWEVRPNFSSTWVSGHWDKHPSGRGWIYTPGHWE